LGTALVVAACTGTPADEANTESKLTSASCRETRLPWDIGPSHVGLSRGGDEYLSRGPQAVAVGPAGEIFVLDTENGRVLEVGKGVVVDHLGRDVEALAIGADGAIAVYSPLMSTAFVFDRQGAPAGSVAIDRSLRETVGISLGQSRQLIVHNAYQETVSAGSPSAPVSLATMLSGKREGAFLLPDGAGIAVRATTAPASVANLVSPRAELLVVTNPVGRRSTVRATFPIPGAANAAMLVGLSGTTACMRVEQVAQPSDRIEVSRRAVCMDATNGRVLADIALAKPEPYKPAHELAFAGSTLAILQPTADALVVRTCEVSR
jgi:hypothetical protein